MGIVNQLSIKQKTYVLVLLSTVITLVLSFVSNSGLNTIRTELNDLIFATKIERYTNRLILEEQNYRLNANGSVYDFSAANQSYENAIQYVNKIYQTIETVDTPDKSESLLKDLQKTSTSTTEYKNLYEKGVTLLNELNKQASILEKEGELITLHIQQYVEAKRIDIKHDLTQNTIHKINNGSNIWQYTYVTRLHEKKYRLSPNKKLYELFIKDYTFMMSEWDRLKEMSNQTFEFEKLKDFYAASKKYESAMKIWVKINKQLINDVLPQMKKLGDTIIGNAIKSAKHSVSQMSEKRNSIALTLLILSLVIIFIGILFGTIIARSISSAVTSFQNGLLDFFQYLNQKKKIANPIVIQGNDEISVMAKVVNHNILKIQQVINRKSDYQNALLEWSKIDYQNNSITMQKATELSAKALHVERVSIWLFNKDQNILNCSDLFLSESQQHQSGAIITSENHPHYFNALKNGEEFVIHDARNDERTKEFINNYFELENIYSVLNVPIGYNNQILGVICYEKINQKKTWTPDELDFANSVVNAISLSLEIKQRQQAQDELKAQKEKLHHIAHHDSLTNLPNRFLFNDRLNQAIKQAQRNNSKISVLFIDLDHFKGINDSMGHNAGDELLIKVAERLKNKIRQTDTLARLGGDEFTIILDDMQSNNAIVTITQSLLKSMEEPFLLSDQSLYITLSIGAAIYPEDGDTSEELIKNADAAMYQAKDDGRNTYQFYNQSMTVKAFERISMEASFRNALKNTEFVVYYQPQINAETELLVGMEALVRWQHPDMGLVSPAKFLSSVQDTGLIIPLDLWVMKTAMQQIAAWHKSGFQAGVLALNLSMLQLNKEDFVETIKQLLEETNCQPQWIELEVTEGLLMKDPDTAIQKLNQIRALGISLAIDDFGTGYSSLSQLKRLPINKLKIDQAFIRGLPDNEEDAVISKSIISLANSMGLDVIAEGVETKSQKDFLLKNGCQLIQGYYYGKPMPANEIENKLKS